MTQPIIPPPSFTAAVLGAVRIPSLAVPSTLAEDHQAALAFVRFGDAVSERYNRNRKINRGPAAAAINTVRIRRSPGL